MAFTYNGTSHRADSLGQNGGTSGSINSTGCDFIVLAVATDSGATLVASDISDNRSNTSWVLSGSSTTAGFVRIHLFYHVNPSVGSGHTFTVTKANCYAAICVAGFTGSHLTAPQDQSDGGGTASGTSISPATGITPSEPDCLVITTLGDDNGGTISDPATYTRTDSQAHVAFTSYGCTMAYKIQTSASAEDPSWSSTNTTGLVVRVASFKSTGGGAPADPPGPAVPATINVPLWM